MHTKKGRGISTLKVQGNEGDSYSWHTTTVDDDTENDESDNSNDLDAANSTSPYPLTPKKLIATIKSKKMVIQTPTLTDGVPVLSGSVQNAIVIPAVVSSNGKTINQFMA